MGEGAGDMYHHTLSLLVLVLLYSFDVSRASVPVRIMPMGDSLTVFDCRLNAYTTALDEPIFQPLDSVPSISIYPKGKYWIIAPGGYRGYLGGMLNDPQMLPQVPGGQAELPRWSYVGSQFLCGSHEGYAGETIAWLGNVTTRIMTQSQPDIVLFMAGTNDFFWPPPRGSRSPTEVAQRLMKLLNKTFTVLPNVTFLLSTVTHIDSVRCKTYHTARWHPGDCPGDMQSNIETYNKMLPEIVSQYRGLGYDISMHDVNAWSNFTLDDYWIWGIHFNNTGFKKMAQSWHKALMATP